MEIIKPEPISVEIFQNGNDVKAIVYVYFNIHQPDYPFDGPLCMSFVIPKEDNPEGYVNKFFPGLLNKYIPRFGNDV